MLQVGKPVLGSNLIGRSAELKLIKELLKAGQSVVIIAPRRMGKTSLIMELLHQMNNESYFTAYTDVFSTPDITILAERITETVLANRKFDQAFRRVLKNVSEIVQNIKFRQEIEDFNFIIDFNNKTQQSKWELLENSLDFIEKYSEKHKKQITVAFDEFGDIKKLDGNDIVKLIRAKIQMHKNAAYIFSGSYESVMQELFVSKNAPFFRMARIISLDNISIDNFKPYITQTFKNENILIDEQSIDDLLDFTKGHPYYTQLYVQEMIIQSKIRESKTLASHTQMIEHLLLIEKNYLEKSWEELSNSNEIRKLISTLANDPKNIYTQLNSRTLNIHRGIKKLLGMGIIKITNKQYQLCDPLLNEWINRNINRN